MAFLREWSSNGAIAVDTENYEDVTSLDKYSDISYRLKYNASDWHFPVVDLCEVNQWLLFENDVSSNKLCILDVCYMFKKKLLCEFRTEIFLQHPFIIQVTYVIFIFKDRT